MGVQAEAGLGTPSRIGSASGGENPFRAHLVALRRPMCKTSWLLPAGPPWGASRCSRAHLVALLRMALRA